MGGGLMQLVAYGAQDVYLTGNPQITFFKVVYRRHTNFSMECSEITMNGSVDFGRKTNSTILRNGDLVMQIYLRVILNQIQDENYTGKFAWVRRIGHAMINYIELTIGGSRIDKHYGTWMDIWYELTHTNDLSHGYDKMVGDVAELTALSTANDAGVIKPEYTLFVPLQFWFCRNPGLALPLIALQYHEVRIEIEFNTKANLGVYSASFIQSDAYSTMNMRDANLLVNYVYLDSEERRKFAQVGHEYLIEQLQFTGAVNIPNGSTGTTITQGQDLNFNHPSKELIWAMKNGNYTTGKSFLAYNHTADWTSALDDAAANLGSNMFHIYPAGTIPVSIAAKVLEITTQDGSVNTSLTNGDITHEVNYTVDMVDARDPAEVAIPIDYSLMKLYITRDVFTSGQYNLGDKIDDVSISIRIESTNPISGLFTYTLLNVTVLTHRITIRDISMPVVNWSDLRLSTALDLIVYQHNNYGCLIDGTVNPVDHAIIQLNGHDRFDRREGSYFNYVQPYEHHTHTPADGINVYSFAISPENHQPSGTANLSRIDTTRLNIEYSDPTRTIAGSTAPSLSAFNNESQLFVYDFNYNVLRIMSGMGGLAYSN
jgi:hypothetical protein